MGVTRVHFANMVNSAFFVSLISLSNERDIRVETVTSLLPTDNISVLCICKVFAGHLHIDWVNE